MHTVRSGHTGGGAETTDASAAPFQLKREGEAARNLGAAKRRTATRSGRCDPQTNLIALIASCEGCSNDTIPDDNINRHIYRNYTNQRMWEGVYDGIVEASERIAENVKGAMARLTGEMKSVIRERQETNVKNAVTIWLHYNREQHTMVIVGLGPAAEIIKAFICLPTDHTTVYRVANHLPLHPLPGTLTSTAHHTQVDYKKGFAWVAREMVFVQWRSPRYLIVRDENPDGSQDRENSMMKYAVWPENSLDVQSCAHCMRYHFDVCRHDTCLECWQATGQLCDKGHVTVRGATSAYVPRNRDPGSATVYRIVYRHYPTIEAKDMMRYRAEYNLGRNARTMLGQNLNTLFSRDERNDETRIMYRDTQLHPWWLAWRQETFVGYEEWDNDTNMHKWAQADIQYSGYDVQDGRQPQTCELCDKKLVGPARRYLSTQHIPPTVMQCKSYCSHECMRGHILHTTIFDVGPEPPPGKTGVVFDVRENQWLQTRPDIGQIEDPNNRGRFLEDTGNTATVVTVMNEVSTNQWQMWQRHTNDMTTRTHIAGSHEEWRAQRQGYPAERTNQQGREIVQQHQSNRDRIYNETAQDRARRAREHQEVTRHHQEFLRQSQRQFQEFTGQWTTDETGPNLGTGNRGANQEVTRHRQEVLRRALWTTVGRGSNPGAGGRGAPLYTINQHTAEQWWLGAARRQAEQEAAEDRRRQQEIARQQDRQSAEQAGWERQMFADMASSPATSPESRGYDGQMANYVIAGDSTWTQTGQASSSASSSGDHTTAYTHGEPHWPSGWNTTPPGNRRAMEHAWNTNTIHDIPMPERLRNRGWRTLEYGVMDEVD